MGTPTPPPSPPGDTCGHCDGILWPAGVTPKFVPVEFKNLVKCAACPYDPPNAKWWFEQNPVLACLWEYVDSLYLMTLLLQAADSILLVTSPEAPPEWFFFTDTADPCEKNFTNEYESCGIEIGSIQGSAIVHWPGP